MASSDIYMDTDRVGQMANYFNTASQTLGVVNTALEAAMRLLQVTALTGLVGGAALERFIASIQPQIKHMAEYCQELSGDLKTAIERFEAGDDEGASRFF